MPSWLLILLKTETAKDTAIVLTTTTFNLLAGGLFFLFVPRILGPADYGLFSTVIATGLSVTSIVNLGIDSGILRFASKNKSALEKSAILTISFKSYVVLGALVAVFGYFVTPSFVRFLGQPQLENLLRIAFSSSIFLLLTNFFVAALQAKRKFLEASLVNISSNLLRLIIFAVSVLFLKAGLIFFTILFFFAPITSVIIGRILNPVNLNVTGKTSVTDFFKFNVWIALALAISSVPYDQYLLLKIAGPLQAGLYAAPFKILTFAYQIGGNFTRVLASRYSSFDSSKKVKDFSLKSCYIVLFLIIGMIFLILFAKPITSLFGEEFQNSISIFPLLSLGFIFFLASTIPSAIILYYFGASRISFIITLTKYIIFIILLLAFLPSLKAQGAAISFTLSEFISLMLMSGFVIFKLNIKK